MNTQAQKEIKRGKDSVDVFINALRNKGWKSAQEIGQYTGLSERELRQAANASMGRIISGQRGYCLIEEADVEDIMHCINRLRHQAAEMLSRSIEIETAMNHRAILIQEELI